jgi:3-phenylpropionate/cinnamic acid dioxygenase small subunit
LTFANLETCREVESFLFREARLLDERRFSDWLTLFTEDASYRMPVRESIQRSGRNLHNQVVVEDELAFDLVNEDKAGLTTRVRRLETGLAHVETPEPISVRIVTNIEVHQVSEVELAVQSICLFFESRVDRARIAPESQFFARRHDRLRFEHNELKIAYRKTVIATPLLDRPLAMVI